MNQYCGPYRIVRQLTTGGMAEIFLARHEGLEGLERTVVLKRILPLHSHDEEFVTMFLDEARLMAALTHPHIAQVFDLGKEDDTYYIAMEHVRGPTLGTLLQSASRSQEQLLPQQTALAIALNVAQALDYIHGLRDDHGRPLQIVHRDLNPANVLVGYTGAVKLIDFGIAKSMTKVYETRTGVIKGTFGYIAPEQLSGEGVVDHRADVFALGVLLYEMCVGAHPFDATDQLNRIEDILNANYKPPSAVSPGFPRVLNELIVRCLCPSPDGRPATMRAVIDQMTDYLGQCGLVPTMRDIARVTHQLVPDTEGSQPIRPLRVSEVPKRWSRHPSSRAAGPHGRGAAGGGADPTVSLPKPPAVPKDPDTIRDTEDDEGTVPLMANAPGVGGHSRVSANRSAPDLSSVLEEDSKTQQLPRRDGGKEVDPTRAFPTARQQAPTGEPKVAPGMPGFVTERPARFTVDPAAANPTGLEELEFMDPEFVEPENVGSAYGGAVPEAPARPKTRWWLVGILALGSLAAIASGSFLLSKFLGEQQGEETEYTVVSGEHTETGKPVNRAAKPQDGDPSRGANEKSRANAAIWTLRVITQPPGALVWVDNAVQENRTPMELILQGQSQRALRVELEGHAPQSTSVQMDTGSVDLTLVPLPPPDPEPSEAPEDGQDAP